VDVSLDDIKGRKHNLNFKNTRMVADHHDDPEALLKKLNEAEQYAATLKDRLESILAKALLR
jgi:type I restriction enzyme M protein